MHILMLVLITALLLVVMWHHMTRVKALPDPFSGSWGGAGNDDPRIAVAAMLHAVASDAAPLTHEQEQQILSLLTTRLGMDRELARMCLSRGRRLDLKQRGRINERLHRLVAPIERGCSLEEKRDVVEMLNLVAGANGERIGPVRDSLGRIGTLLLHGW
jgi:uncharacterized tellurite resistance protein B-like protein